MLESIIKFFWLLTVEVLLLSLLKSLGIVKLQIHLLFVQPYIQLSKLCHKMAFYCGVSKQSRFCLSSGSIPQQKRNKLSSLLYDCVCLVSWPVRSCGPSREVLHLTKKKPYQKKNTSSAMLRVLLTFLWRDSTIGLQTKGFLKKCMHFKTELLFSFVVTRGKLVQLLGMLG